MTEETLSQEFKRIVDEKIATLEQQVALEMWAEKTAGITAFAELLALANKAPFKDYQDKLSMTASSSKPKGSSGKGGRGKNLTEADKAAQVELVRSALTSLKAKNKSSGVSSSAIFEAIKGDGEAIKKRWNAIKTEMKGELDSDGELRKKIYWLKG